MEAIHPSETSVLTKATLHHIQDHGTFYVVIVLRLKAINNLKTTIINLEHTYLKVSS
jgi:hypothetical protein